MVTPVIQFPPWSIHVEEAFKLPRISRDQARWYDCKIVFSEPAGLVEVVYTSYNRAFLVSDPSDAMMAPLPPLP